MALRSNRGLPPPRRKSPPVQRIEKIEYALDLRTKPIGYFIGGKGKNAHVRACPVCAKGAIYIKLHKSADGDREEWAHVIEYYLDNKNNPQPRYSGTCWSNPP